MYYYFFVDLKTVEFQSSAEISYSKNLIIIIIIQCNKLIKIIILNLLPKFKFWILLSESKNYIYLEPTKINLQSK